jgi:hypothetical protein
MTDRELLELAAKAAGEDIFIDSEGRAWIRGTCVAWVPQDDDGQSRRLEVKLRIKHERHVHGYVAAWAPGVFGRFEEPELNDPYAATRRAIFRAAAGIGRHMK